MPQWDRRRITWLVGGVATALVVAGTVFSFSPKAPPGAETRTFVVPSGAGLGAIATSLREQGFIRSALAFRVLATLTGSENQLKAGLYALTPAMSPREILRWMVQGKSERTRLTFPEGYSIRQMAQLLERQKVGSAERFLELAASPERFVDRFPWLSRLPEGATLEGFLFPDTYEYGGTQLSEAALIGLMLARFEQVGLDAYERTASPHLDLFKTVTLASIVELEAQSPPERPLIAGVFYNRLRLRMPLGSDPTVEYALGWKQGSKGLSFKDVKVDSPYNTYRYPGLPPGPIANPGLASLKATLNPESTSLLYFVARGDGTHEFTRTYAEHLAAQRRIRQR